MSRHKAVAPPSSDITVFTDWGYIRGYGIEGCDQEGCTINTDPFPHLHRNSGQTMGTNPPPYVSLPKIRPVRAALIIAGVGLLLGLTIPLGGYFASLVVSL